MGNKGAPTRKNMHGRGGIFELSSIDKLYEIMRRNIHLNKNFYDILEVYLTFHSKSTQPIDANQSLNENPNGDDINANPTVQSSIIMPVDRPQPSVKDYIDISDEEENSEDHTNLASLRRKTGNNIVNQNIELK
ncbi:MAG TPA: hypothetical protein VJS91_06100, partial [Nitrososphaeraceae archaeon]|nr:hypothetical protein [Nitrososphaeraceae archaeon]